MVVTAAALRLSVKKRLYFINFIRPVYLFSLFNFSSILLPILPQFFSVVYIVTFVPSVGCWFEQQFWRSCSQNKSVYPQRLLLKCHMQSLGFSNLYLG